MESETQAQTEGINHKSALLQHFHSQKNKQWYQSQSEKADKPEVEELSGNSQNPKHQILITKNSRKIQGQNSQEQAGRNGTKSRNGTEKS